MNYYVDMHANLLPGLAGLGQRAMTEQEAVERLAVFRENNMKIAAAAPYYRPELAAPAEFLAERDKKIAVLSELARSDAALSAAAQPVRIVGGAVVPFTFCMEHPRELRQFAVGESEFFLVDLPECALDEAFCEQIGRLRIVSGMCPVAADIDRRFTVWSPEELVILRKAGILLQISVNGILRQEFRKLSLFLLANQHAHFIASGSRSIEEPLRFIEAMRIVQRSLPAQIYRRIKNNAGMLLSNAEPSAFL